MGRPRKDLRDVISRGAEDVTDVEPIGKSAPRSRRPAMPGEYPIRLGTVDELRIELGRVYKDARTGRIDTQDATRLGYLLDLVRKMIETDVIAKRIEAIEARAAQALPLDPRSGADGDADLVQPVARLD